jgi:hypothetical protein
MTMRSINNSADVARKFPTEALADGAVTAEKLADGAVEAADVADGSITAAKLAANAVTGAKIAAGVVTKAKTAMFVSTEQTGTGAAQDVAHGLGAVPSAVLVCVTEHPGTPDTGAFDVAEGAHDGTNVKVTVTLNVKFKVMAWA